MSSAAFKRVSISGFLAQDFAALDARLMQRCLRVSGQRVLLTGATGFFGKSLLSLFAYLHSVGARFLVLAVSRNPVDFLAAYPEFASVEWLQFVAADLVKQAPTATRCDLMIHAATDTHAEAHRDPMLVFQGMCAASQHALQLSQASGVRRLLLCGSGAQYGPRPRGLEGGYSEDEGLACDPTQVGSAYAEAKRVTELLAALMAARTGCEVINTRCFAFVGPGLATDGHFAVGNFIRGAISGQHVQLNSPGSAQRSYLYGADLAVWLLLLLLEAPHGKAFNVGSDQPVSILELAQRVVQQVSPLARVTVGEASENQERLRYWPNINCARAIGLDVWTPLDKAILRTADFLRGLGTGEV